MNWTSKEHNDLISKPLWLPKPPVNWWTPSTPETITPYPWLHPAAVCYLDALLDHNMDVIEHGCGGSTLWLARRVRTVTAHEKNKSWVDKITALGLDNVTILHGIWAGTDSKQYDMLFVDGFNHDRPMWIRAAPRMVKPGGIVVVDNTEREQYQEALAELQRHCYAPTIITAWTGLGKKVETRFYRLKGGVEWI